MHNKDTSLIKIKKSKITNAGLGAFAKEDIGANQVIGEYKGEKKSLKEISKLPKDQQIYLFEVVKDDGKTFYIDAMDIDASNWTRYVNSVRTNYQRKKQNTNYIQVGNKIMLQTLKDIKKGEELLCDYGDNYWHYK